MTNLTRTPAGRSSRSRLVLVRPPSRSVRRSDEPDRAPMRVTIGIVVTVGVVALVWLLGHLGFRLGFAPLVRAPDLLGDPGGGLATGVMMLIAAPRAILAAGIAHPMWLMLAFTVIAIPSGALAAAKPAVPGGPLPNPAVAAMSATGAVAAVLTGGLLLWWTGSAARAGLARLLPLDPSAAGTWYADLQAVAGLDVLVVIGAAVWMVLVFRLAIPTWLRAIAASTTLFTLVVTAVAMATTSAAATQAAGVRSLCLLDGEQTPRILLGNTAHHAVTLRIGPAGTAVEWRNQPEVIDVIGQQSIVGFLEEAGAAAAE